MLSQYYKINLKMFADATKENFRQAHVIIIEKYAF